MIKNNSRELAESEIVNRYHYEYKNCFMNDSTDKSHHTAPKHIEYSTGAEKYDGCLIANATTKSSCSELQILL